MAETAREDGIHLETEEDAWELYRQLLENEVGYENLPKLTVGEWANVDVYIPAKRYDSAITPYMMNGWIELQRTVYRAYSLVHGGEAVANTLSDREKDRLELVVEVREGSSDQSVDIQALLEALSVSLVDKMEPNQILIAVLTLILTLGGRSVLATWLSNRKDEKLAELELLKTKEIQKAHLVSLETIAAVAGVDAERRSLLDRAASENPMIAEVRDEAERGRAALVKYVTKTDAVVNGVPIKAEAGQSLTSKTRSVPSETRLDGLYKIRKVDTTAETGFRVHLSDRDGKEVVGDVAEMMTTLEDRRTIQEAEWSKVPVFLQINAKLRREQVVDAIIVRARAFDPETDGDWR